MLAFGTQVRGFKPGRSRRIFQGEEILSTPSFGKEVKFAECYVEVGHFQAKFIGHFSPKAVPPSTTRVGTTKNQGLYNKLSTAVHPGALAARTVPQYSTIVPFIHSARIGVWSALRSGRFNTRKDPPPPGDH